MTITQIIALLMPFIFFGWLYWVTKQIMPTDEEKAQARELESKQHQERLE
jgi:hypothetical protein